MFAGRGEMTFRAVKNGPLAQRERWIGDSGSPSGMVVEGSALRHERARAPTPIKTVWAPTVIISKPKSNE